MHDESVYWLQSHASEVTTKIRVKSADVEGPSDEGCPSKSESLA